MALRKRKSKLTELFPEREALRVRPIKPKTNNIKKVVNNKTLIKSQTVFCVVRFHAGNKENLVRKWQSLKRN